MTQRKARLVIIDPQLDFMPGGSLAVPKANEDMDRLAAMIDRIGGKISDIHVTLDSHHLVDVGHPAMWRDIHGNPPADENLPMIITADDIKAGVWTPRASAAKPWGPQGETIRQYMIRYAETLERQGNYMLTVWPVHCLIGTSGAAVYPPLMESLNRWAERNFANVDFITKGTNPWTEHYGALHAEVPMPSDPTTSLETSRLQIVRDADMTFFAGEAKSHCLKSTVGQFVEKAPESVGKIYLLTDATSSIDAISGGPDFPALTETWERQMVKAGMNLTTTTECLA
jgi:nicotinamidase-related amidase